jgi:hypothetical protein
MEPLLSRSLARQKHGLIITRTWLLGLPGSAALSLGSSVDQDRRDV